MWNVFKMSIQTAHPVLPLVPELASGDWVKEEVQKVSRRRQEAWLRWTNDPGNETLKTNF